MTALNDEISLKRAIIDIGQRLWARGYVAANDGNISVRTGKDEMLITPTGVSKGFMSEDMIIRITMDGKIVSSRDVFRPSSEYKMHARVYKEREDINAIVHAHPPYSTAFAVAGIPLDKCALPETILTLGAVPVAAYGTPSTDELPDSIREHIKNNDAILLANHGALTAGVDLLTAYHRMETLEHTAAIMHMANGLGKINELSGEQVRKLMDVRARMNIPGKINLKS
jgi:L-fuculose-phosphate aldolase